MPNITSYIPSKLFDEYKNDKNRKGLIAKLLAEHYGFEIVKSGVVAKNS